MLYINGQTAVSSMNVWDLYNKLTYFASHNPVVQEIELAQTRVLRQANYLLSKKRDITNYHNIY